MARWARAAMEAGRLQGSPRARGLHVPRDSLGAPVFWPATRGRTAAGLDALLGSQLRCPRQHRPRTKCAPLPGRLEQPPASLSAAGGLGPAAQAAVGAAPRRRRAGRREHALI